MSAQSSTDRQISQVDKDVFSRIQNIICFFLGNNAERILDHIETLEARLNERFMHDEARLDLAQKFMDTFKAFRQVVHACFGCRRLDPEYEQHIAIFMETYRSLNISVPVKFHILEAHCGQFLKMFDEKYALGYFSEQSMEACHSHLKREMAAESQVIVTHPKYGEKLVKVIARLNGKQI